MIQYSQIIQLSSSHGIWPNPIVSGVGHAYRVKLSGIRLPEMNWRMLIITGVRKALYARLGPDSALGFIKMLTLNPAHYPLAAARQMNLEFMI